MGIADGAKANWTYLKKRTDRQTLDFYHASGYLGKAADAMFTGKGKKHLKTEWLDEACHKLKHNSGAASRLLREMEKCIEEKRCSKTKKGALEASVTYFTNNKHMMKYAKSLQENLSIGSGVTEAACKTLVKHSALNIFS